RVVGRRWAGKKETGRTRARPKRAVRARDMLMEVPAAAAEVAAAKAAHVADVCAGEMTPAELADADAVHVAKVSAYEMTATELAHADAAHVAEVSAGEMSPAAVESEAT